MTETALTRCPVRVRGHRIQSCSRINAFSSSFSSSSSRLFRRLLAVLPPNSPRDSIAARLISGSGITQDARDRLERAGMPGLSERRDRDESQHLVVRVQLQRDARDGPSRL